MSGYHDVCMYVHHWPDRKGFNSIDHLGTGSVGLGFSCSLA
jgi:hypothetical protein